MVLEKYADRLVLACVFLVYDLYTFLPVLYLQARRHGLRQTGKPEMCISTSIIVWL